MGDSPNHASAHAMEIQASLDLMSCPKRWARIFSREGRSNVLDLVGFGSNPDLPAHRKLLVLILLLVIRDRATELRLEPWRFDKAECEEGDERAGYRMWYHVDGQECELVAPPRWVSHWMVHEVESVADLNRLRCWLAGALRWFARWLDSRDVPIRQGEFLIRLGKIKLEVVVWVYASSLGRRYHLTFGSRPDDASAVADDEMKRLLRIARYRPFPGLCPDLW